MKTTIGLVFGEDGIDGVIKTFAGTVTNMATKVASDSDTAASDISDMASSMTEDIIGENGIVD
jgi:hypothetical protein